MLSLHLHLFRKYIILFFIIAGLGFADASFLSVEHYLGKIPPCSITNGCEKVTTSTYSVLFGIPVAYAGAVYYISLIMLLILFLDLKKPIFIYTFFTLVAIGFLGSLGFTYLQFFVIKALCPYCLFSAGISTALFFFGLWCSRGDKTRNNIL